MAEEDRDIFRVAVMKNGVKSSISMDGRFAYHLRRKFGSDEGVRNWVRDTVIRLESTWSAAAAQTGFGQRVRAETGFSRAIQREALEELLQGVEFSPLPGDPSSTERLG